MKRVALLLALIATCTPCVAAPFRIHATLVALSQVETRGRGDAIGAAGERSAWQFMPDTWRIYTSAPFEKASTDPVLARLVAETHLRALVARLKREGRPVTVRNVARLWNPHAPAEYAELVQRLADLLP